LLITDLRAEDQDIAQAWDQLVPGEAEAASAALLLQSAPKEIKQLFDFLLSDAAMVVNRYGRVGTRRGPRPRETSNAYFCRVLGLPVEYDIVGQVEHHFLAS
jgi:hypothetical protein